jgi:hypothetical protein
MKINRSVIVSLILILAACSLNPDIPGEAAGTPTFTPWVEGTAMAVGSPTPYVAGTETALAMPVGGGPATLPTFPPPGSNPTEPIFPQNFSPILYGKKYDANTFFVLLGGVDGNLWLAPDRTLLRFAGAWDYDGYTFAAGDFQFHGELVEFSPTSNEYYVRTDSTMDEFGMVAVARGWQVTQRRADDLSSDNEFYRQVVTDWLTQEGVAAPQIDALRVWRVDLEGDGVDEIFLSATRLDGSQHMTKAGDYSIVLMRKVSGNNAVTRPILADIYRSRDPELTFPCTYSLGNFIDLNRDGVLEVVVDIQRWENFGAIVYQIDDQDVIQTLGTGC